MFNEKGVSIKEITEARKQKIAGDDAWKILGSAEEVVVGKGKKFQVLHPSTDSSEDILKVSLGRTGNLRAPTLKIGKRMVVGFNEEMYRKYIV